MLSRLPKTVEALQCHSIQGDEVLPSIATLISQYGGSFDHKISLIDKAVLVNKRPYRYPGAKKDIIEKLVQEMLDQGVVQHSTNPYASPVVLVRKLETLC